MNAIVIDCSVAIPWFFPERDGEKALSLRDLIVRQDIGMIAPELLKAEFGNVAWKKVRRGQCSPELASMQISNFLRMPMTFCTHDPLLSQAFALACERDITVYDALYLVLARETQCALATLDERLAREAQKCGVFIQ